MKWSFFDAKTGEFSSIKFSGSERLAKLNAGGLELIEGDYDYLSQRVDIETREVVDHQPPQPSVDHEWRANVVNGRPRWVKKPEVLAREGKDRAARAALEEIDRRSIRAIREILIEDPAMASLEREAAEHRKDVIRD